MSSMKRTKTMKCPGCGNIKLMRDYERAELICTKCGMVIDDRIMDMGPEWCAYTSEEREKLARTGPPSMLAIHDKGLPTMIDWRNRDFHGKDLTPKRRAQMYRLRKWQRRIRVSDTTEHNLAFAFSELERMASYLNLPRNVRDAAAVIYRRAAKERLIRGRSIEGVVAVSLYAACGECKVPRMLSEIAEASGMAKRVIARDYKFITNKLGIHSNEKISASSGRFWRSSQAGTGRKKLHEFGIFSKHCLSTLEFLIGKNFDNETTRHEIMEALRIRSSRAHEALESLRRAHLVRFKKIKTSALRDELARKKERIYELTLNG